MVGLFYDHVNKLKSNFRRCFKAKVYTKYITRQIISKNLITIDICSRYLSLYIYLYYTVYTYISLFLFDRSLFAFLFIISTLNLINNLSLSSSLAHSCDTNIIVSNKSYDFCICRQLSLIITSVLP